MGYLPEKRNQHHRFKPDGSPGADWGTKYDKGNCWATATAEAIDFATEGKVKPTPPEVRQKSGNLTRLAGYINPDIYAAADGYGIKNLRLDPKTREPAYRQPSAIAWEALRPQLDRENSVYVMATDYDVFPDKLAVIDTFDGNHSIPIFGGTVRVETDGPFKGQETILGSDPLANKRKRYPVEIIRKAAQKVARHEDPPLPDGYVYATKFRQALPPLPPPVVVPPPPVGETPEQKIARLELEKGVLVTTLSIAEAALQQLTLESEELQATNDAWVAYADTIAATRRPDAP